MHRQHTGVLRHTSVCAGDVGEGNALARFLAVHARLHAPETGKEIAINRRQRHTGGCRPPRVLFGFVLGSTPDMPPRDIPAERGAAT